MERKHLALFWSQRVVSHGGWSGKLRGAYLAPRSRQITHVLVQHGLRRRPQLVRLDNARQEADGILVLPEQRHGVASPGRGSVPFTAKTVVHCSEGVSLLLQGFILDCQRRSVEYVLVGSQGEGRAIQYHHVQKLASGSPSIALGQAELEALPLFRPDNEAQRDALAALAGADATGDTFRAVDVQVVDGTAYLAGHVRFPIQRTDAERAVGRATGILAVQSSIVTDWDLSIAIAQALAQEGLTRQGLVLVKSLLGRVRLSGHLATQELVDDAVAVAGGVAGVRSVGHDIQVRPLPAPEPAQIKEPAEHQ